MQHRLGVVVVLALLVAVASSSFLAGNEDIESQFETFVKKFDKPYANDPAEYQYRLAVFTQNLKTIAARNEEHEGTTQHGITKFADMTKNEFQKRVLMRPPPLPVERPFYAEGIVDVEAPSSVDWRNKTGVLTKVYDQQQCGSCWAFSATENIESQWALAGYDLTELSMQQIVDCDPSDSGCGGGWPSGAYKYVISAPGQETLSAYPYTGEDGNCAYDKSHVAATFGNWTYTTLERNELQMASYVATKGPISVCVDASEWSDYTGGVFLTSSCPSPSIDHCVLAVGYNLAANPPYWIIRNSWGTDWGMKGYMYLEYGKDTCAVAQVSTSAIVASKN